MMRSSIYHVLEKMDALEKACDRYSDKAWDKAQEGNMKSSDYYDRKCDLTRAEINGMKATLKMLGLDAWLDDTGHWHIPMDDIIRAC